MAEDDTISAMWCSLVPTMQYKGEAAQPNTNEMTETEADDYNYAESEAETSVDVEALSNYIEARVLHLPPQHILPNINYWNQWDYMPHTYPITGAEHIDHYVQGQGQDATPINYSRNEQEITQTYSKAGELSSDVKNEQGNDIKPIRRVLEFRRKADSNSHVPNIMSIGPYHYSFRDDDLITNPNDPDIEKQYLLYPAKKYKKAFLSCMLKSKSSQNKCIERIKEQEKRIEQYYQDIQSFQFWEKLKKYDQKDYDRILKRCLMIDACAILGFLHIVDVDQNKMKHWIKHYADQEKDGPNADELYDGDPKADDSGGVDYSTQQQIYSFERDILPRGSSDLLHEIILMENQIPYIVLEIVYDQSENKPKNDALTLKSRIINYLNKNMLSLYSKATPECPIIIEESIQFEYILDYCHIYFKPTLDKYNKSTESCNKRKPEKSESTISNRWRRATDLYEAGIAFKRFECHCRSLLDINFENGVLEIPTLTIDLQTRTLFSNIIAFEQKLDNPNTSNNYFTAYVKFMADLVTTVDDIKLLARKRIIEHHFRTDEHLLQLFEDLMKGVRFRVDQDNYLTQMFTALEDHYESRPKKWWADLTRKHCNTPWKIIGSVFGIVISTFTIVQTVYAIKGK